MALKTCDRAIQLFNKAWAPIQDEIWVMDDFCPLLEVQVDVLNASKKLEQALAVLDEFETFAATLRVKFPLHVGRLVTLIYIGLKRHSVLVQMGNEPAALEVENHLRSVVETSKGEIGFKDALRHVAKGTPLPESIQRLLVE